FQAEDGIRDGHVTGVQTCALPISCITGAVGGALVMQGARARWSTEAVASMSAALLGATIVATAMVHVLGGLVIVMLVGGAAWIRSEERRVGKEGRARCAGDAEKCR